MKKIKYYQRVVIDTMLGRTEPQKGLSIIKYLFDKKTLIQNLTQILNTTNRVSKFLENRILPRSYEEVFTANLLEYRSNELERELLWNAIMLKKYKDVLNVFIDLRNRYEVEFINGNYKEALSILSNIEENVCYSLWSLKQRFILEEYMNGLESNKEFLSRFSLIQENDPLTWFADIFSYKAEKTITQPQYDNRMNKLFLKITDVDFKPYMYLKIFGISHFNRKELADILYFESKSSIVDRYISLIKVLKDICAMEDDKDILSASKLCIDILGGISDKQLNNINVYLSVGILEKLDQFDIQMSKIGDLYTCNEYEQVIELCNDLFRSYSNSFQLYEYYVKSLIFSGKQYIKSSNSIRDQIIVDMYNSYTKLDQELVLESNQNLQRYIRLFDDSLAYNIFNFYANRFNIEKNQIITRMSELNSSHLSPRFCLAFINSIDKINFLRRFESQLGYYNAEIKLFLNYFENIYYNTSKKLEDINIFHVRKQLYNSKMEFSKNNLDLSLEILANLEEYISKEYENNTKAYTYFYEKISTYKFKIYLEKKDFISCLDLFTYNYLKNKFLTLRMDCIKLLTLIENNLSNELKAKIGLPILTHICHKDNFKKQYTAYANYLDSLNLEKPTQLINAHTNYPENLIYFLREICIPNIMDSAFYAFNSEEEVEEERIAICKFLRKFDPKNDQFYVSEISQITQEHILAKRIHYLDESKIDIDLKKIRNRKKEIFSENYKRYMDIGSFELSYNIVDLYSNQVLVINYFNKKDHNAITEKKNQKFILFKELFLDYRDEFAFGQYGLDSSLSTRIRHGRLQNQIRNVFEQYHLICSKNRNGEYVPNEDIDKNLQESYIPQEQEQLIHDALINFSQLIDDTIDYLNEQIIRIKTKDLNPKGFFDLMFDDEQLLIMLTDSYSINNDEQLIDYFDTVLMKKTENGLRSLKMFFCNELKQTFIKYINELEHSLSKIINKTEKSRYISINQNLVNCRTAIQREIGKVAEWFKLPQNQEHLDFDIDQLLETLKLINRQLYLGFDDLKFKIENSTKCILKGFSFSYCIDILIILITNAIVHSGFKDDIHKLYINLKISEDEDFVYLEMRNNLSESIDRSYITERVNETKKRIEESQDSKRYYSFEGGSGYVKIVKMIQYNLYANPILVISLSPEDEYVVNIYLSKSSIVLRREVLEDITN